MAATRGEGPTISGGAPPQGRSIVLHQLDSWGPVVATGILGTRPMMHAGKLATFKTRNRSMCDRCTNCHIDWTRACMSNALIPALSNTYQTTKRRTSWMVRTTSRRRMPRRSDFTARRSQPSIDGACQSHVSTPEGDYLAKQLRRATRTPRAPRKTPLDVRRRHLSSRP